MIEKPREPARKLLQGAIVYTDDNRSGCREIATRLEEEVCALLLEPGKKAAHKSKVE